MQTQRVAFQGEPGAYGEIAALDYFPKAKLLPAKSFQTVFEILESGKADFAVVPIENSIEGSINETYDLLLKTSMVVCGEIYQRIRHCLIANPGTSNSEITAAYSHPQALAQCRAYLQKKGLEPVPTYDTAGAVKLVKQEKMMQAAAIASKRAANLYGMRILEESIEDKKNNYTRFLILSKAQSKPTGHDGTSIIFSVRHTPGALYDILKEFAKRRINLTKIESRPTKEVPWEYNFYVDFEGHSHDKEIRELINAVKKKTLFIKILGSYKRGKLY
ncbi:MAG TPA: prephenate dehydratase [Nitrososphaeraceae archaeon]